MKSNIIHDLIKIRYVNEGYLPNWPYHMIADDEMCDAFIRLEQDINNKGLPDGPYYYKGYFFLMYPLLNQCLNSDHTAFKCSDTCTGCYKCDSCGNCTGSYTCKCCKSCRTCKKCDASSPMAYSDLVKAIHYHVNAFKHRKYPDFKIPDWVLSYMLGSVVSVLSPTLDIHDIIEPLNVDNVDDLFQGIKPEKRHLEVKFWESDKGKPSTACLQVSKEWMKKIQLKEEIQFAPIELSSETTEFFVHPDWIAPQIDEDAVDLVSGIKIRYTADKLEGDGRVVYVPHKIDMRPPTMFGEPHIIKHIRVNLLDPMREVGDL